jgi:hypothetical protein
MRRSDLHIGLLTGHELTRVLQMRDTIQEKLNFHDHANGELAEMETETKPDKSWYKFIFSKDRNSMKGKVYESKPPQSKYGSRRIPELF